MVLGIFSGFLGIFLGFLGYFKGFWDILWIFLGF